MPPSGSPRSKRVVTFMVSNNSTLGQDWDEVTSGIASGARKLGQMHGLVDWDVIPGNAAEVGEAGEHLSKLGSACERVATGIHRLDTGDWTGQAAEQFRANYLQVAAPQWQTAADAFGEMGQALTQYAQVLAEQQQRATQAQAELEQAKEQARSAAEAHNAQIDTDNPPAQPFQDPTAEKRAQAQHTIARAKDTVAAAGDRAAATMRSAASRAPAQPGAIAKAAGWVSDFASRNVQAVGGMATGFGHAVAGLGGLALGAFKAELYFGFGGALIDPEGAQDMVNGVTSTASAAVSSPDAAWSTAKTMVGVDTWKNHPTQALGEAVPNALAYATGGGGAVAAASKVAKAAKGARAGERVAEAGADVGKTTERAATVPESEPRFSQAAPWHHGELPGSPGVRLLDEPDTTPALRDVPNESTPLRPSAPAEQWPSARGEHGFDDGPSAREPVGPDTRPEAHSGPDVASHEPAAPAHGERLSPDYAGNPHYEAGDHARDAFDALHPRTPQDTAFLNNVRTTMPEYRHLHDQELLAINRWTQAEHYQDYNQALRSGDLAQLGQHDPDIRNLVSGINKTPEFDGRCYRGMHLLGGDLPKFLEQASPGATFREPGFSAADPANPWGGNVELMIDSRQGHKISDLSESTYFDEVLFGPGSEWKVQDRWFENEQWKIWLTDR